MKYLSYLSFLCVLACTPQQEAAELDHPNPPSEGFDMEGSDQKAMLIADEVMEAMGGRENWDNTRYVCWNFFGARLLIWDKYSGDVRIESNRDSTIYLININDNTGRISRNGIELEQQDSIKKYVDQGKRIWINDSYWLTMPYKLKDSGVTLTWLREDTTQSGIPSDVLQLQFKEVGVTPDNRYEVWVDTTTHLVRQWAYYQHDSLSEPGFILPWNEWTPKGEILLSGNRGERSLTDIHVFEEVSSTTFLSFEPVILPTN